MVISEKIKTQSLFLPTLIAGLLITFLPSMQIRAQAIQVRIIGQSATFSSQDHVAISAELNGILANATGYAGSSATATVVLGRALSEAFYHPVHRATTRAALAGNYDYLVMLPETRFLADYPEVVFEGALQMSRVALNAGATPLLLMPGATSSEVNSFGPQVYRIANGCGIAAIPGGYAVQAGGLLAAGTTLDLKRKSYLIAATLFTQITGLNAATASSYVATDNGTPIDVVNLANIAATTVATRLNTVHYSTPRETAGRVRFRPITPANNTVRYAWTGTSTETGIRDALNPILIASGYSVSDHRISSALGWSPTTFETAKTTFDTFPNQILFAYGRAGFITLPTQTLIDSNQSNLIPFNFDRHYDGAGTGTTSISNMLDDVYNRTNDAEIENSLYGWAAIPFHLGIARLNDLDPAIIFSSDGTHVTSPLYNMMASMMVTSALGRNPTPTAGILASPEDLKGFNVGRETIKQLAFLAETEAFVPDTKLTIVGMPVIPVTRGVTVDQTLTANHGTPPYTWVEQSAVGLPAGLTLSASGRLTGVTTVANGSRDLVLRVRDSAGAIRKLPQTLTVTSLAAGTNAFLSNLTPGSGLLAPAFDSNVHSYTATVSPNTSTFTVTPLAAESSATIRVNGTPVTSNTPSAAIALSFGPNVITTEVVSQNLGQTKTYTLTVTRAAFSPNADLASLTPSEGTLTPSFDRGISGYTTTVFDNTSLTLTATAADPFALIRVNGVAVDSGSPSSPITLVTGLNPITIQVQSSDLSTTRNYTLTVTQEQTNLRWWDGGSVDIAAPGDGISQGGSNGVWNTTVQNWDQGPGRVHLPWQNDGAKSAIFGGTPGTVTAGSVTVGGMTFGAAFLVTGGNITFANSGTIANSAAVTIASAISGTGPIIKEGPGTLTLSSPSNVYSGGTQITAGKLTLENNVTGTSNFTISNGADLEFRTLTGNRQLSQGTISGTGNLIKSGSTQLLLGAQNNPQTVSLGSGAIIDVQAGVIRNEWGNSAYTNNKADLKVAASAFFDLWDGNTVVDAITGAGVINKAWSGNHTLTIGADNGSGIFSGRISNTNSHGGSHGGVGGGTLNLVKTGTGTQTLSGINTYIGTTTVSAGTLALVGGSQTSPVTVSSGASLGFTIGSPTTSTSSFNLAAGTIRVTGTPTLGSHTLITASSSITGTPTLHSPLPGYALTVDGSSLKLVRILSYAIWAATHAPTGTAAEDFDGDGISNGVEYILGGSRNTRDHGRLPNLTITGEIMTLTFQRHHQSLDGLSLLFVDIGTSLTTWPESHAIAGTATANNTGITIVKNSPSGFDTVTLRLPRGSDNQRFARLRVLAN